MGERGCTHADRQTHTRTHKQIKHSGTHAITATEMLAARNANLDLICHTLTHTHTQTHTEKPQVILGPAVVHPSISPSSPWPPTLNTFDLVMKLEQPVAERQNTNEGKAGGSGVKRGEGEQNRFMERE